jgi:hypothetical protein
MSIFYLQKDVTHKKMSRLERNEDMRAKKSPAIGLGARRVIGGRRNDFLALVLLPINNHIK